MVTTWSLLGSLAVAAGPIGLVDATAQSITGGDDSVAIASEVRAFLRDRAAGDVPALVDHVWPAKIKPTGREDRDSLLTRLATRVRDRVASRTVSPDCAVDEAIVVVVQEDWAVAAVLPCRPAYAAGASGTGPHGTSLELIPLQRIAGKWKVSGRMP